jgi:hypothetical protein
MQRFATGSAQHFGAIFVATVFSPEKSTCSVFSHHI